jgi:hypothetical protein
MKVRNIVKNEKLPPMKIKKGKVPRGTDPFFKL